MKGKMYISGKITGLPIQHAKELFTQAEKRVRELGYEPVNPMADDREEMSWEDHMILDIAMLFPCDGIFMLSNYFDSTGARIERHIAVEMGKVIIYQKV